MHVGIISGYEKYAGGMESVVDELSNYLIRRGARVTIFFSCNRDFAKISQNCKIVGVRPYNILPTKLRFAFYETYSSSLKIWTKIKHEDPFDIIHAHSRNSFFPALFRNKTPFIQNFHGTKLGYYHRVFGPTARILKSPRTYTLFLPSEVAAKKCDIAIACSNAVKDELIALYGVNRTKIRVIYNGVDINKFRPFNKKEARKTLRLPENKNYAIWVGSNLASKGLSTAIKAVRSLKNIYLLVIGVSQANFGNIIFWGRVQDHRLLCTLYNAADFLIFPSLYEGFPLVPLEALACGLPIIISKECPTREIIEEGVEGFIVDNREPEYYAEIIETILKDDACHQEIPLRCRKLAEKYSWENQGKEYLKVYEQLMR